MSLPIRTTVDDLHAVCSYLATKPTGATLPEAKAVVDRRRLDGRKLTALKFWGLVEDDGDKLKITDRGRRSVKDSGALRSEVLREVVSHVRPYMAVVERVVHRREETISATDVAAHWHEHFTSDVSDSDKILNDQAVCFFQIAQGARLVVGRKGMPTRGRPSQTLISQSAEVIQDASSPTDQSRHEDHPDKHVEARQVATEGNRVFITHGKNLRSWSRSLVSYGKFEPVVAMDHEAAQPVQKIMGDMRTCRAAVIHVSAEGLLFDSRGMKSHRSTKMYCGAAMALLVEEGVTLPSNLQGLYECP